MTGQAKVAVVTGASRGIGAEIAKRLARDGFLVAIDYSGDQAPADAVVAEIEGAGGAARAIKADVSSADDMRRLFDQAQALGELSGLVNNAGVMKLAPLAEVDDALIDQHLSINLKGVIFGLREAAKRMGPGGRIVSFSSSVVGLYPPTYSVYAGTKAAVEAMTHILTKELKGRDITVNAVAPGPVATELFLKGKSQDEIKQTEQMNPLGRLGQPSDIASVVSFLLGPDGGWVNGQVLRANGGVV